MLNDVVVKSPAKLNLHLRVYPKRDDGYHNIESIFQAIDFFDELTVTKTANRMSCVVEAASIKLPVENTLTVAYKEFCAYTGLEKGIHVKLDKQIYSGAGLGGGSSNGASLIHALDSLFETSLSREEKVNLASRVGSDVPFFMYGGAAVVTGRGEIVRNIELRNDIYFVILMPNIHSSTKNAFALFDEQYKKEKTPKLLTMQEAEDVYRGPVTNWGFTNSFTDLLIKKYSCIGKALDALNDANANFFQMSGSGAAVYGVFGNEEEAKKAYTKLSVEWKCQLAQPYSIVH